MADGKAAMTATTMDLSQRRQTCFLFSFSVCFLFSFSAAAASLLSSFRSLSAAPATLSFLSGPGLSFPTSFSFFPSQRPPPLFSSFSRSLSLPFLSFCLSSWFVIFCKPGRKSSIYGSIQVTVYFIYDLRVCSTEWVRVSCQSLRLGLRRN